VHPTTLGGSEDYARSPVKVERLERGVKVTRWAIDTAPPPFIQKVRPYAGRVDRWNVYDFLVPGIFLMDSGMAPTGTGAREGTLVDAARFHGCQALTPESENATHYFFGHPHDFAIDRPDVTQSIHDSVVEAFKEDRAMVTAQARNLEKRPDFRMVPIRADGALSQYRWIVERMLEAEAQSSSARVTVSSAAS